MPKSLLLVESKPVAVQTQPPPVQRYLTFVSEATA
jgi:hypothetical protein